MLVHQPQRGIWGRARLAVGAGASLTLHGYAHPLAASAAPHDQVRPSEPLLCLRPLHCEVNIQIKEWRRSSGDLTP
jgi:hypothetical protein